MHRRLVAILILLAPLMIAADAAPTGVERVTVHVKGMACPFCAYNLEKRIKTLKGVPKDVHWRASVEKGTVGFDWKPEVPFDADAVRVQVRKAGFTPGKIETKQAETKEGGGGDGANAAAESRDRLPHGASA